MFAFVSNWSAWRRYAMYYESSVWQNKTLGIWEVTVHTWCTFEYRIDRHLEILGPRFSSHPRWVSDMQLKVLEPGLVLMLVNWYYSEDSVIWWLSMMCPSMAYSGVCACVMTKGMADGFSDPTLQCVLIVSSKCLER